MKGEMTLPGQTNILVMLRNIFPVIRILSSNSNYESQRSRLQTSSAQGSEDNKCLEGL
jgi:hypothetical protein